MTTNRKNILIISVDDMCAFWRYRDVFGVKLHTPNLDRIIAKSTHFTSAYCQAPVCGPSRASAMSGLSPMQTGIFDNYINLFDVIRPEQLWQHKIKQAGYYCSTAGKVHHGFKPLRTDLHNALYSHPPVHVHFGPRRDVAQKQYGGKTGGSTTDPKDDRDYYDHRSARHAANFLLKYNGPAPFYREVGFHHPHIPLRTPDRFKAMYDHRAFTKPADWANGFTLSPYVDRYLGGDPKYQDTEYWQKTVRNYFSAITHVDEHIGRVWDVLQASRHAKNTVVVIFSDHGYHLGDKDRFRKLTLYEEVTRIPLIIHDPDSPPTQVDDPVGLIDLGPTLLDYTGCEPLQNSPGTSLRNQVQGARKPDRTVPSFWYGNLSARSGPYRMSLYQDGSVEFYNVTQDLWFTQDLGTDHPDFAPTLAQVLQAAAQHGAGLNDHPGHYGIDRHGTQGGLSSDPIPSTDVTPGYRRQYLAPTTQRCETHIP
ncbi:MAG: sulfatase-like hydrolase/transferase, partial [Pseudomonadota bacterium]